ncbi:hypothetical protein BU17DRAFT_69426 [Hysterangium stoloniferum]|nr:hypothetical protein BU17DRAFT_69426 [Hysterangium stoloniferum]
MSTEYDASAPKSVVAPHPVKVFIDGIAQITAAYVVPKPESFQHLSHTPNFDKEAAATIKCEGLPPLIPWKKFQNVIFPNPNSVWSRVDGGLGIGKTFSAQPPSVRTVLVQNGKITCAGSCKNSIEHAFTTLGVVGGSLASGLATHGLPLGIAEIVQEPTTQDGDVRTCRPGSMVALEAGLSDKHALSFVSSNREALKRGSELPRSQFRGIQ